MPNADLAEGEGFEPPDLSVNGFQDRRLKPLGHPSARLSELIVTCGESPLPCGVSATLLGLLSNVAVL